MPLTTYHLPPATDHLLRTASHLPYNIGGPEQPPRFPTARPRCRRLSLSCRTFPRTARLASAGTVAGTAAGTSAEQLYNPKSPNSCLSRWNGRRGHWLCCFARCVDPLRLLSDPMMARRVEQEFPGIWPHEHPPCAAPTGVYPTVPELNRKATPVGRSGACDGQAPPNPSSLRWWLFPTFPKALQISPKKFEKVAMAS